MWGIGAGWTCAAEALKSRAGRISCRNLEKKGNVEGLPSSNTKHPQSYRHVFEANVAVPHTVPSQAAWRGHSTRRHLVAARAASWLQQFGQHGQHAMRYTDEVPHSQLTPHTQQRPDAHRPFAARPAARGPPSRPLASRTAAPRRCVPPGSHCPRHQRYLFVHMYPSSHSTIPRDLAGCIPQRHRPPRPHAARRRPSAAALPPCPRRAQHRPAAPAARSTEWLLGRGRPALARGAHATDRWAINHVPRSSCAHHSLHRVCTAPEEWQDRPEQRPSAYFMVDLLADKGALRLLAQLVEDTCPPDAPDARPSAVQQVATALVVRFLQAPQVAARTCTCICTHAVITAFNHRQRALLLVLRPPAVVALPALAAADGAAVAALRGPLGRPRRGRPGRLAAGCQGRGAVWRGAGPARQLGRGSNQGAWWLFDRCCNCGLHDIPP